MREHDAVTRAVHRLQTKLFLFDVEAEHVFLVVRRVTGRLPEVKVVNIRRDDFVILVFPILFSNKLDQVVVDARAVLLEKTRARGEMVEKEQLLVQANGAVIAFLRFFDARGV